MKAEIAQNFLSTDKKTARDSYGEFYTIGEEVGHEGAPDGEMATIYGFVEEIEANEIKVFTSKGNCHLDFLYKKKEEDRFLYLAEKALAHVYTDMLMLQDGSWVPDKKSIVDTITNIASIADAVGAELKDTRDGGN